MHSFTVTRRIDIDAGHRIMTHGSKCRHLHGHRYGIEATCAAVAGALHEQGEQTGMVLDFGFLKDEMLRLIDAPCDHGFMATVADDALLTMFAPDPAPAAAAVWLAAVRARVAQDGFAETVDTRLGTKLYVLAEQPTAECLARHWFLRLQPAIAARSDGLARLMSLRVWETPNCVAEYSVPDPA